METCGQLISYGASGTVNGSWWTPPMLDAGLAYEIQAFLHWLRIGLYRLNIYGIDPFDCFDDVAEAFELSFSVLEKGTGEGRYT